MVGGAAPVTFEHCSFSIGGKRGMNGIFGIQLASASKNALQQARPMLPNFPMNIEWEISAIHPGISITDDQHLVISGNPDILGIGWNGNGKGKRAGNCGSWAFTETTMHITARNKITFLIAMMRRKKL